MYDLKLKALAVSLCILVVDSDMDRRQRLVSRVLEPAGYCTVEAERGNVALALAGDCDLALVYHRPLDAISLLPQFRSSQIDIPFLLLTDDGSEALAVRAFRTGVDDYLSSPYEADHLLAAIRAALERHIERRLTRATSTQLLNENLELTKYLQGLDRVIEVSKEIAGDLLVEDLLKHVTTAAAIVSEADTASIMLLDDDKRNLLVRASHNLEMPVASTMKLSVAESLAGKAISTGLPVFVNGEDDQKIKTSYFVKSVAYVPLAQGGEVTGVLAVDNRVTNRPFTPWQVKLLTLLADFASIALSNANLYTQTRQDRDQLNAVLRGTEDPVLVIDDSGRLILHNPAARTLFGIPDNYDGPADHVIDDDEMHLLLVVQQPQRAEIVIDEERAYIAQMALVPGVGRVIVMHDITALKELDRLKTDFVASVSQDLRSPLTAILGYVELLSRAGSINEQQQMFIDRIVMSAQSITNLITDLLDLSRIENANLDAAPETVNLAAVIEYALATVEGQVRDKQQHLTVQLAADAPLVYGNPQRLKQLVRNLVLNATQYTPECGVITIRLSDHADLAVLQVEDSGIGIPLDEQPHIFEKFYRASNVRSEYEGSGLGLAIVRSIVERHNGRIWVESLPGRGTTFTVILPAYVNAVSVSSTAWRALVSAR